VLGAERMPSLVGGNTDPSDSRVKNRNRFSKQNFESGLSWIFLGAVCCVGSVECVGYKWTSFPRERSCWFCLYGLPKKFMGRLIVGVAVRGGAGVGNKPQLHPTN
jgi:hypothetical protein